MSINEGALDRTVRIVVGLLLVGAALGLYGPSYTTAWGWVGLVPLITGAVGLCPAYSLLGINTCRRS
jgi:hypothetical protein